MQPLVTPPTAVLPPSTEPAGHASLHTRITSQYKSLQSEDRIGDFQFSLLHRTLPYAQSLSAWRWLVVWLRGALRWLGGSQQERFGLDNASLPIKNVPQLGPARLKLLLTRD